MDNEIIQKLTEFSKQQHEKMTTTISDLIANGEENLGMAHTESSQIDEYAEKILYQRVTLQSKLSEALISWHFEGGDRSTVDGLQKEITELKTLESEVPILQKEGTRRIQQAIKQCRFAQRLPRKLEYCHKLEIKIIETDATEPPNSMIRDLKINSADLPGGKEMAEEFIAKLQLKYPKQLGK